MDNITIRKTTEKDRKKILDVGLTAFSGSARLKTLLTDLLEDPTAAPYISLMAFDGNKAVGHVLFTKAKIRPGIGFCSLKSNAYIMGPVSVIPDYRGQGIGKALIRKGLEELKDMGIDRCFTLGHSNFRPGFGFRTDAARAGWPPPFPLAEEDQQAWMWVDLATQADEEKGKVICANAIMRPMYWKIRKRREI